MRRSIAVRIPSIATPPSGERAETRPQRPNFPIASEVRLAGDDKQTRFILDLDRPIQFRAFALADPYRVVVDIPQVIFSSTPGRAPPGAG